MFNSDVKMARLGRSSRFLICSFSYVFVAVSVIGVAFFATMALMPVESAVAAGPQVPVGKIGPGYARMQPVDFGKPEKVAYSTPYYPRVVSPRMPTLAKPAPSNIAALVTAPPKTIIAEAVQSSYSRPDVHRVY